jgi:hypothetical protein
MPHDHLHVSYNSLDFVKHCRDITFASQLPLYLSYVGTNTLSGPDVISVFHTVLAINDINRLAFVAET